MPVTERRDRRRLAQRGAIVDAARAIVRADGVAALTMRRIAEAVDYSPASLYAHFESRDALLAALCGEGMHDLRVSLESAAAGIADPRERLIVLGKAYVGFALERPETYRLIFMENQTLTKAVFALSETGEDDGERALGLIAECLRDMRDVGALRASVDPASLGDLIWTIVHGVASLRIACPDFPRTDDATLVETAVGAIVDGSQSTRTNGAA